MPIETIYKTSDGLEYKSFSEAEKHEEILKSKDLINTVLKEHWYYNMPEENATDIIVDNIDTILLALNNIKRLK